MCTSWPLCLNVSHDITGVPLLVLQVLRDHYPCIDLEFGFRCFVGRWGVGGTICVTVHIISIQFDCLDLTKLFCVDFSLVEL